jgi:hypothetical protein
MVGNISKIRPHGKKKHTFPTIARIKFDVLFYRFRLKQKLSSQNLKLETMQCEIDCLKQKNQTILDYANQRLQEMMGNQKLIEINGKVYRDIKNYLDDK